MESSTPTGRCDLCARPANKGLKLGKGYVILCDDHHNQGKEAVQWAIRQTGLQLRKYLKKQKLFKPLQQVFNIVSEIREAAQAARMKA